MFLAKIIVGPLSGALLDIYCTPRGIGGGGANLCEGAGEEEEGTGPVDEHANCPEPAKMWAILGSVCLLGALGVWAFEPCLSSPRAGLRYQALSASESGGCSDDEDDADPYDDPLLARGQASTAL